MKLRSFLNFPQENFLKKFFLSMHSIMNDGEKSEKLQTEAEWNFRIFLLNRKSDARI
jgi:hypothetical protein